MIDKQVQDLAWKCLPKEIREHLKCVYKSEYVSDRGYQPTRIMELLLSFFGHHNLTSDAEPEEMLIVPRNKVQEKWQRAYEQEAKYSKAEQNPTTREELYYNRGIMSVIDTLFGTKCLPDEKDDCQKFTQILDDTLEGETKEPIKEWYDKKYSNVEKLEKNGEVELKFKPGDKVLKKDHNYENEGCPYDIFLGYIGHDKGGYLCAVEAHGWIMHESDLEPYTEPKPAEPKFNVGNIVRFKYCCTPHRIDGFRVLDGIILYLVDEVWAEASDLEPYTEPEEKSKPSNSGELESQATTDCNNMEKKGLNLCDILKGHEGKKVLRLHQWRMCLNHT